jgi:hypothetical protein
MLCMCIARIRLEIHVNNRKFCTNFLVKPKFLLVHRNRYSEGMDDGQKTPHGHPDFNSYVKILLVFIWNRQMNRQTDIYIYFLGGLPSHSTQELYPVVYVEQINPVWASLTTFLQVNWISCRNISTYVPTTRVGWSNLFSSCTVVC